MISAGETTAMTTTLLLLMTRAVRLCLAMMLLMLPLLMPTCGADQDGPIQVAPSHGRRELAVKGKRGEGFWSVKGSNYYDGYGNRVWFSGVQWSGFETDGCAHGLWSRNYKDMLKQMKAVGFNMLRLSFAGETLKSSTYPNNINYALNKDLQGLNSLQVMDKIIKACPTYRIKVILDYHRMRLTAYNEYGLWYDGQYPESVWIKNWVMLAKKYAKNPTVIGFDLFNEVHNNTGFVDGPVWKVKYNRPWLNYRWATVRAVNAIQKVNKNAIIFLEGMWNETWWGGNLAEVQRAPIISKHPHKIAYSAHEYGPHVFQQWWFTVEGYPKNMPYIWDKYWGNIARKHIKPVWVGEFGSFLIYDNNPINVQERKWLYSFRKYIRSLQLSWTWFQWGPDSRDTGGILLDDWTHVNKLKTAFLKPIMHPQFGPSPGQ